MLLLCFSVCKRHKAFLPEFVYLCLLCNTASVILIKCSTLKLYGEWNNCSIGAKVTDSAYEHSELFSSQAPLLFWILVSCCQSLFQIKHIGVEGGRGETGYFVQKKSSHLYILFFNQNFAPIYTIISWIIIVSLVKLLYFPFFGFEVTKALTSNPLVCNGFCH